ncbi:MAG TPA: hypothetical protein VFI23_07925 [Rhizomicrobium sp.]|nr:hypothetical protein [Rhizomicrobium sp.]
MNDLLWPRAKMRQPIVIVEMREKAAPAAGGYAATGNPIRLAAGGIGRATGASEQIARRQ